MPMTCRTGKTSQGCLALALVLTLGPWTTLGAQERMPPIPPEKMTAEQKKAIEESKTVKGLGSDLTSPPFHMLLRVPELVVLVRDMRNHISRGPLNNKLVELAILIIAREWTQNFEWDRHYQGALKAGLTMETVTAIREGRRPPKMAADEELVYDFSMELLHNHSISDAMYAQALKALGEPAIVELAGVLGYYTLLAMAMNVTRMAVPPGRDIPYLEPFPTSTLPLPRK